MSLYLSSVLCIIHRMLNIVMLIMPWENVDADQWVDVDVDVWLMRERTDSNAVFSAILWRDMNTNVSCHNNNITTTTPSIAVGLLLWILVALIISICSTGCNEDWRLTGTSPGPQLYLLRNDNLLFRGKIFRNLAVQKMGRRRSDVGQIAINKFRESFTWIAFPLIAWKFWEEWITPHTE